MPNVRTELSYKIEIAELARRGHVWSLAERKYYGLVVRGAFSFYLRNGLHSAFRHIAFRLEVERLHVGGR